MIDLSNNIDKLLEILNDSIKIQDALNSLHFNGYSQCKTFTNLYEVFVNNGNKLKQTIDELTEIQNDLFKKEDKQE